MSCHPPEIPSYDQICDPAFLASFTVPVYVPFRTSEFAEMFRDDFKTKRAIGMEPRVQDHALPNEKGEYPDEETFRKTILPSAFYQAHEARWEEMRNNELKWFGGEALRKARLEHDASQHIYPVPLLVAFHFKQVEGVRGLIDEMFKDADISRGYYAFSPTRFLKENATDDQYFLLRVPRSIRRVEPIDVPFDFEQLKIVVSHLTSVVYRRCLGGMYYVHKPVFREREREWAEPTQQELALYHSDRFVDKKKIREFFLSCLECDLRGPLFVLLRHPSHDLQTVFLGEGTEELLRGIAPEQHHSFLIETVVGEEDFRRTKLLSALATPWALQCIPPHLKGPLDVKTLSGVLFKQLMVRKRVFSKEKLTPQEKGFVSLIKQHSRIIYEHVLWTYRSIVENKEHGWGGPDGFDRLREAIQKKLCS